MTTTRNRETGTLITMEPSDEGPGWQLICESHYSVCHFDTITVARSYRAAPSVWCADCAAIAQEGVTA
jgi:hypothetical protein